MKLSELANGRDNNFNLVRILAAFAVLIGHSFPLALGKGADDPAGLLVGLSLGTMAVDAFFVTSGFLVTASLLTRANVLDFAWARVLRIFPALAVTVTLTVFGLGLFFTSLPAGAYLADPKTLNYLVKNIILVRDVVWALPGVFESNPFRNAVNGSLWTLPKEIKMYALLALVWIIAGAVPSYRTKAFTITVVLFAVIGAIVLIARNFHFQSGIANWRLFFMFFAGAAFYVLRDRINLSRPAFWVIVAALALSAFDKRVFFVVYVLTLAYALLYLAYVPSGRIRLYNRVGDYSYGVYIYAFPVQQSVAALIPGVSVWGMILISSAVTLALAMLSWHLVEWRALNLKGRCAHLSRRLYAVASSPLRTLRGRLALGRSSDA